eukprot:TRINITY_DN13042_c0_g1_i1.p1 TRINITY_DN13042_c0_g1~~TRINITY_DN13042_c0_g1_i1.p1  ORF type:complete len:276 (+),score=73.83 TRINITY_DN13042_c0_g1_i1:34-861(+)
MKFPWSSSKKKKNKLSPKEVEDELITSDPPLIFDVYLEIASVSFESWRLMLSLPPFARFSITPQGKEMALKVRTEIIFKTCRRLIDILLKTGLEVEGIGRISCPTIVLNELWSELRREGSIQFPEDPIIVMGFLKRCLRELPEPLLLFSSFEPLLKSAPKFDDANISPANAHHFVEDIKEGDERFQEMCDIVRKVSVSKRRMLDSILHLLFQISKHQEKNRMHAKNLSVVFSYIILQSFKEDKWDYKETLLYNEQTISLVETMILHHDKIALKQK